MLRLGTPGDAVARWRRRAILRFGFLGALGLAATEIGALVAPFIRVNRIEGLGNPVAVGTKAQGLEQSSATNDRPISAPRSTRSSGSRGCSRSSSRAR